MDKNNSPKKSFSNKTAVVITIIFFVLFIIIAAAGVTVFILLNKESPPAEEEFALMPTTVDTTAGESDNPDSVEVSVMNVSKVQIIPTLNTPYGIEIDTEFIVKTSAPVKISELADCIAVKSGENYELRESETECEYVMSLVSPLKYDSIYNIEFTEEDKRPVSFAFQTVEDFKVIGSTPANDASEVPLNSGIEITFNEKIDGDYKDYFSINPFVNGKFDNVGNTYIFIPDDGSLMPNTRYDITVQRGLKSGESGKVLGEDYCFSFRTEWGASPESVSISGNAYETFLPDDEIFVEVSAGGAFLEKPYSVDIYELNTPAEYLQIQTILWESPETLNDFERVGGLETKLLNIQQSYNDGTVYTTNSYIMFGHTLESGWYVIKITAENEGKVHELYKFIQVSPLSVYSAVIDGEMLFWINDATTGLPVSGAEITADEIGQQKAVTDKNGVAVINTAMERWTSVTVNYADYPAFVYAINSRVPVVLDVNRRYYHYVYTDRKAYRPTDTIDVFGVIQERYGDYKITPDDRITLKIGDMTEIPITLDSYGSFNVKIPIKDMKGYLNLELYFNGEYLDRRSVNIVDYDNAKYVVDANTDRWTYRPGETAEIAVSAGTYDGTRAEGLEIMRDNTVAAMTDSGGGASITEYIEKSSQWNSGWQPYTRSFYYNIGKTENKIQYIGMPYVFIPSDIMLEHEIISESKGEIAFTSSFIDRDTIEKSIEESWYNAYILEPDLYRGGYADIEFTVEIHKYETIRTKTGERYDYINKVNVPMYSYSTNDTVYGTETYSTVNGKVLVEGLPVSDDLYVSYYVIVKYNDTDGNPIEFRIWYGNNYRWGYDYSQSSIKRYYFNLYNGGGDTIYSMRKDETGYIKLSESNGNASEITDGKILTVMCHSKNKIVSTNTGSPDGTPVIFTEDCIYNALVVGAYFDGKYIYPVTYGVYVNYDYSEKTLDFDVSFDKESYLPGDEVKATIKIADENGNPKKGVVNISVVDESVFAEYENNANMPTEYYSSIYNYINYDYFASYTQHEFLNGGGAEMGDGGSDDYMMRKDFTDNPAFVSVETDDAGFAEVTFKLAEKITSWRVTVHGITKDNYVGNIKKNIISSMPFAVDLVMNDEYIVGDDISVIVKPQGNQYKYNYTESEYTAEILSGGEVIASQTETSKSNAFTFKMGKLPEGEYIIRMTAEAQTDGEIFRDGMEKDFKVVKTGVLLPLTAREIISDDNPSLKEYDIKMSPVRMTMSNSDMAYIMDILNSCINYSSNRTDYMAANVFDRKFTESIYNKTPLSISPSDYNIINYYGYKSELNYGSPDVLYTARFYACFPETASEDNKNNIREYIYNNCHLYNDGIKSFDNMTPEFGDEYSELNRAAGYLALAAAGDSVLLDIYEQINIIYNSEYQEDFTESYQSYMRVLYYAAALCTLGDDGKAEELIEAYPFYEPLYYNTTTLATKDMQIEYTNTLMLYINTKINPDKAYEYLKDKQENEYVSDVCEKINFVRNFTVKGGTRSEIEYTLDGETKRAVFENYDMLELILTKEQFNELNIKQISGNTAINLSFYGSPENLNPDKDEINLEKRVLSRDEFYAEFGEFINSESDTDESAYYTVFKFKLPNAAPRGYYTIRDRLPNNMRYLNSMLYQNFYNVTQIDGNGYYYVNNPEKQFVDILVYACGGVEMTVAYNAIKISDADAVTEKAYISRNFNVNDIWGVSR